MRPDLLAAASAVAALREEERMAEDELESWAEEEVEPLGLASRPLAAQWPL